VGHEGMHAAIVLDNGTALFTGVARRGEDGDTSKHRRTPKATRPKKIFKVRLLFCIFKSNDIFVSEGILISKCLRFFSLYI
jgi:hypothetical protein